MSIINIFMKWWGSGKQLQLLLVIFVVSCNSPIYSLKKAISLEENNNCEGAIKEYQNYFDWRLASKAEGENPYFYKLRIGFCELKLNRPEDADKSFTEAKQNQISIQLVADAYKRLAEYYEFKGELQKAFDILKRESNLDQMIFNIRMDELSKKILEQEDARKK